MTSEAELDLTPRPSSEATVQPKRRLVPNLLLIAIIAVGGFVLYRTLSSSALFFYNADEAVERRAELDDRLFRVQGTPFTQPVSTEALVDQVRQPVVVFPIRFEGATIDVVLTGAPADLFQPGVPVVLDGRWVQGFPEGLSPPEAGASDGWYFAATEMVVKHENDYRLENKDRLDEAERGGNLTSP